MNKICTKILPVRDRPFNLGGGRWLWFFVSFRIFFPDNTRVRKFIFCRAKHDFFFTEFNIRLYDNNSESDFFFFLHQNQNIFFSNIGNQNIFWEKNHTPPFKLNGRSLNVFFLSFDWSTHICNMYIVRRYKIDMYEL